jgi:enamine deaminase RidA (YjgF/YER057c/UK114 family)
VIANGFGFVSGQALIDPATNVADQGQRTFRNQRIILPGARVYLDDVVMVNTDLSELTDFHEYYQIYNLDLARVSPARTTTGYEPVGIEVETDDIAVLYG